MKHQKYILPTFLGSFVLVVLLINYSTKPRNTSSSKLPSFRLDTVAQTHVPVEQRSNINNQLISANSKQVTSSSPSTTSVQKLTLSTPTDKPIDKIRRYTLCSSYWEQQINGILNLFCFQRWANSVGLTVVEPFVHMSELKFSHELLHDDGTISGALRLRDYIDIDYWNERAKKSGVPTLESWKNFGSHSTKKIIVVIISYNVGTGGTFLDEEINTHPPCLKQKTLFFDDHSKLFNKLNFEVTRVVCISFSDYITSPETFSASLQIENKKQDITIWFSEWRGVESGRVAFTGLVDNIFGRTQGGLDILLSMIHPSKKVLMDSKQYVRQVIGSDFGHYNAVVFRVKPSGTRTIQGNNVYFNKCADELDKHLKSIPNSSGHTAFLAIDMGRFGDTVLANKFDFDNHGSYTGEGKKLFQKVLHIVYGNKSIESYENDFIQATNGVLDSGYVGALQRTIAINARSLVVIGGHSKFQMTIVYNMKQRHRDSVKYLCSS
ncbi:uncharacterized protein [Dysidea avara]